MAKIKKEAYLSQFKKTDEDILRDNVIINYLYHYEFLGNSNLRFAGGAEFILIESGYIKDSIKGLEESNEYQFLWFKYKIKESYFEVIARLCWKYLIDRNLVNL